MYVEGQYVLHKANNHQEGTEKHSKPATVTKIDIKQQQTNGHNYYNMADISA